MAFSFCSSDTGGVVITGSGVGSSTLVSGTSTFSSTGFSVTGSSETPATCEGITFITLFGSILLTATL